MKQAIIQTYESVIGSNKAYYLSGPITSGSKFIEWNNTVGKFITDENEKKKSKFINVIQPNNIKLQEESDKLREIYKTPIINPASLCIKSFTNEDYITLWIDVINKFVTRMFSIDDWYYSYGCIIEFRLATKLNMPISTISGLKLNTNVGLELIKSEILNLKKNNDDYYQIIESALDYKLDV